MLFGYNTKVPHNKKIYDVQTEDKGEQVAQITTVIYCEGSIVVRRKKDYTVLLNTENYKTKIRKLVENEHKEVIEDLVSGKLNHRKP